MRVSANQQYWTDAHRPDVQLVKHLIADRISFLLAPPSSTVDFVANSKTKPKPRGNPKSDSKSNADESKSDLQAPVKPAKEIEPVKPRPWLFRISLALFICWLLYLSYVAYVVLLK